MNSEDQAKTSNSELAVTQVAPANPVQDVIGMISNVVNWVEPQRLVCGGCASYFFYPHLPISAVRGRVAAAVLGREPGIWDEQRAAWYQIPQGMDDGFVSLFCGSCGCYCHWSCAKKTRFWGTRICPRCENRLKLMRQEPVNSSGALCPKLTKHVFEILDRTEVCTAVLAAITEEKHEVAAQVFEAVFGAE
jgi:hypothetical protein